MSLQNLSEYQGTCSFQMASESYRECLKTKITTLDLAAILAPNPDSEISGARTVKWDWERIMESLSQFQTATP